LRKTEILTENTDTRRSSSCVLFIMLGVGTKREGKHLSKNDADKTTLLPNEIELEKVEKSPNPINTPGSTKAEETGVDESTDSENDPAAGHHSSFRRKLSTNKQIKTTVSLFKCYGNLALLLTLSDWLLLVLNL